MRNELLACLFRVGPGLRRSRVGGSSIFLNSPIRFLESVCIMHFQTNVTTKRSYQAALGSSVFNQFSRLVSSALPRLAKPPTGLSFLFFFSSRSSPRITHFRLLQTWPPPPLKVTLPRTLVQFAIELYNFETWDVGVCGIGVGCRIVT